MIVAGGGTKSPPGKIIMGGPMMGKAIDEIDRPILKHNNTILVLNEKDAVLPSETACIQCGACVRACPSQLLPHELDSAARRLDLATLDRVMPFVVLNAAVALVCPSKRHLVQNIIIGKDLLLSVQKKGRTD